ncbi:MAG: cytochrome c maturation protein CcmE [Deltaproteobacteria bacterium]|nr:cytochrome c maturation protein CcmE [Deltaproteobacteria bacterium]MBI2974494.1 cytochrome c maturation protein CcmE [Deltaproteobacteria bacterium]
MKKKYIIGLAIISVAFLYLVWTSFKTSFQFALTPSEFISKQAEFADKSVKISGLVGRGSINANMTDYNFLLSDDLGRIHVHYKGIVPNTFREGAEVVATGRFNPANNIFEATELLTKCASKYEAKY